MYTRNAAALLALIGAVVAGSAGTALSAPINYGDFTGILAGDVDFLQVTEDSGTDPTPLYGPPMRLANHLFFFPQTFASSSANGSSDTTVGSLTMTIRADTGYFLETITIDELGDTTLAGVGTPATITAVGAALTVNDLVPGTHGGFFDSLVFSPSFMFSLPADGFVEFNGTALIDLSGLGIREVALDLGNVLESGSEAGTTSFIQKKIIDIGVASVPVPEPASVSFLACAALMAGRRRARRRFCRGSEPRP